MSGPVSAPQTTVTASATVCRGPARHNSRTAAAHSCHVRIPAS